MLFIVIHHVITHIFNLADLGDYEYTPIGASATGGGILLAINTLTVIGVNLFALITGYFSVHLKWKTITNLYLLCLFYISVSLLACSIAGIEYKLIYWYKPFLLFHRASYWFMSAYLILVLVSPMINRFLSSVNDTQLTHNVILLIIINCGCCWLLRNGANPIGYHLIQLIFMYITGAWINRCNISSKISARRLIAIYLLSTVALCIISIVFYRLGSQGLCWMQFNYTSPLVVTSAITLFLLFAKLNFKSKLINRIAQSVIAVYLIQEGFFGTEIYDMMRDYMISVDSYLLPSVIYVIVLFTAAILIDRIRILLFRIPARKISDWLTKKFPLESYF